MKFFDSLLSLVAPYDCLGCERESSLICHDCRGCLPASRVGCYRCHVDSPGYATCPACRLVSPLTSVRAATRYDGIAKDIVWQLKFGRSSSAAREMAAIMALKLRLRRQTLAGARLLVTHAPTATTRVRQRGYDQAQLIARCLARDCGLPYRPLLRRRGHQKQVGASKTQRAAQLSSAFYAVQASRIRGSHIILVDDVVTTGATLEAAAAALLAAGARRVDAIVFAQA